MGVGALGVAVPQCCRSDGGSMLANDIAGPLPPPLLLLQPSPVPGTVLDINSTPVCMHVAPSNRSPVGRERGGTCVPAYAKP